MAEGTTKVRSGSEGFIVDEVLWFDFLARSEQDSTVLPPMPGKMLGRPKKKRIRAISWPRKKQPVDDFEDVDVVQIGLVRDKGASGTKGGSIGSKDRGGRGAGGCGGASGSIEVVGGAKRNCVNCVEYKKNKQRVKYEQKKTRKAEPTTDQLNLSRNQVEDQVEQTEDQAEIDLTQVEQTQEQTQEQVQPQEQPQTYAYWDASARILQINLGKQGSSQNTTLNLD
ncbi:hypothetical protein Tco_0894553 [Tanacetum coccineum]|uniref:Uncharacterized protein n=1 Tax=Tanacetum coccineum TaxID=301880 RepID=A0ABQ5CFB8_9ASTR